MFVVVVEVWSQVSGHSVDSLSAHVYEPLEKPPPHYDTTLMGFN